ncbi:hypothetical protein [Streptomyces canus]|uniref:hypothetical protein n=1 Tax=Streptomyces canus TaxID=58343 RepID=UPI002E258B3A
MSPIGPPQAQDGPSGFDPGQETPPLGFGVWGDSAGGSGVVGSSGRPGTTGPGGTQSGGAGVLGINNESHGIGVLGTADADGGTAVLGTSSQGTGVCGRATGLNPAVAGTGTQGPGVSGTSEQGTGVTGTSTGGAGLTGASTAGAGVTASSDGGNGLLATSATGTAVAAFSNDGIAVLGRCGHSDTSGFGFGFAPNQAPGVMGTSFNGPGVQGLSIDGTGVRADGQTGIIARGTLMAGSFEGDVNVTGNLTKGGGGFRIDHPLDPENRYLAHSFVESPEMKNIYDGTTTLDAGGTATVDLPDWFEALNENFHYQLTAFGGPAPNLHISRTVTGNRFSIAGGDPRQRVCWQVTGTRRDAWARANPVVEEAEKAPQERGYYLHPGAHGQSAERAVAKANHPEPVTRRRDATENNRPETGEKR